MSSMIPRLLIERLEYADVFSSLGHRLADQLGASVLLYAAISYYAFDEEFNAQSLIDNHSELEEEIMWWLEEIFTSHCNFFRDIRTYHDGNDLTQIVYEPSDGSLYIESAPTPELLRSRFRFARSPGRSGVACRL